MTIAEIYENAKRKLDKNEITLGEFNAIVDRTCITLNKNVTNGDVIKTLFSEVEVREYANDPKGLKVSIFKNGYISMGSGSIRKSWWNALYKAEGER